MKIGIVTFHFSDNFGAALQAYALRDFLDREGHDVEFVNYCPDHVEKGGRFRIGVSKADFRANLKVLYLRVTAFRTKWFGNQEQKVEFEQFRKEWLGLKKPKIHSLDDLRQSRDQYDLLICGSDQIWSPSVQQGLDPAYFLDFGEPPVRRISFAASFGAATLDSLKASGARELLGKLDTIAVREKNGLELIKTLTGREADWVCDPTCLLESYEDLIASVAEKDTGHVFCYALRTDEGVRETAQAVAAWENSELISPGNPFSRWSPIGITVHPGPARWLSLISRSKFVVTNSFHGTMFSILLGKPFIVVGLPGKKVGLNDRMLSLLDRIGLTNRFIPDGNLDEAKKIWSREIDWHEARKNLSIWRNSSVEYLRREIQIVFSYEK